MLSFNQTCSSYMSSSNGGKSIIIAKKTKLWIGTSSVGVSLRLI